MDNLNFQTLDKILFSILLGFSIGIVVDSNFYISINTLLCLGFTCSIAGFLVKNKKYKLISVLVGIFVFSLTLGVIRFEIAKPNTASFSAYIGTKISIRGVVSDSPNSKSYGTRFTLKDKDGIGFIVSTKGPSKNINYGDDVFVSGILKLPENFQTDQGNTFDYVSYLYKDNILYQITNATPEIRSRGHGNFFVNFLDPIREKILSSYLRILPSKEASLLGGLNLGVKENIDKDFRNELVKTGTIHMIALSGYNVTIVAKALRDFLSGVLLLSGKISAIFGVVGIILFIIMTGMQSSAIRAGIMAVIAIFAGREGRAYDAFRALLVAGFVMIFWNPKYLVYDVSFQLSFLATLGIIFITPLLEKLFMKWRIPEKILWVIPVKDLVSVTLGAQIGVTPFILYKMGTFSLISLPANFFALPAVPLSMAFGAFAGFVGIFSIQLAYPISIVVYWLLRYLIWVVGFFASFSFASISVNNFPIYLCVIMYGVMIFVVRNSWKLKGPQKSV